MVSFSPTVLRWRNTVTDRDTETFALVISNRTGEPHPEAAELQQRGRVILEATRDLPHVKFQDDLRYSRDTGSAELQVKSSKRALQSLAAQLGALPLPGKIEIRLANEADEEFVRFIREKLGDESADALRETLQEFRGGAREVRIKLKEGAKDLGTELRGATSEIKKGARDAYEELKRCISDLLKK